jgi:DNA-binding winged helix-turn-helix (wHTH) protein
MSGLAVRTVFREFVLDVDTRQLTRAGAVVHLSPKAFQLLCALVEARPAVIERDRLRRRLWPDAHVVDAALGNLVAELRAALGPSSQFIRTVHGVGYAFSGEATPALADPAASPDRTPRFWMVWEGRVLTAEGDAPVVGRDPGCAIWIDAPGVSRRHARLHLPPPSSNEPAVIEDLSSTNGTYVQGRPITAPTRLDDGDSIELGEAVLTFRVRKGSDTPTRKVSRATAP